MQKILLFVIAWTSSLVMTLSTATADSLQGLAGKSRYLELQGETVVFLNQINLSHIQGLKTCLCRMVAKNGEPLPEQCDLNVAKKEPQFLKTIVNVYGTTIKKQVSCESIVEIMLSNRIRDQWREMRIEMALAKPESETRSARNADLTEQWLARSPRYLPDNLDHLIARQIVHRIQQPIWRRTLPVQILPPLTSTEIRSALDIYFSESVEKCTEITARVLNQYDPRTKWIGGPDFEVYKGRPTEDICRTLLGLGNSLNVADRNSLRRDFWMVLNELFFWRRDEFREKHNQAYVDMIQNNPLLVAVSSESPSHSELIKLLSVMEENARERLKDSQTQLSKGDLISFLGHIPAYVYTQARWSQTNLPSEDIHPLEASAKREFELRESLQHVLETGGLVATVTICALPWGRGLKGMPSLFKRSCLALAGLPLNAYFLYDSMKAYDETFKMFFSSYEANQAIKRTVERQQGKWNDILFDAALFPVGLNLVAARDAASALAKLLRF